MQIERPELLVALGSPKHEQKRKQGSVFSQKPYFACETCNTGWMKRFEDEMCEFSQPLFISLDEVKLTKKQTLSLAGWCALITILAELLDQTSSPAISFTQRKYLKRNLVPPSNWTIIAANISGGDWYSKYRHHALSLFDIASEAELRARSLEKQPNNTLISTFGMGRLLIQVFVSPNPRFVGDYRATAASSGLIQIWPIPYAFWPFAKRLPHFPSKIVLDDVAADVLADAFRKRIKQTTADGDAA